MMHVERMMTNLFPGLLKYEHLKSCLIYLTDNDLIIHVVHTSIYGLENDVNGTALLLDLLCMACFYITVHIMHLFYE